MTTSRRQRYKEQRQRGVRVIRIEIDEVEVPQTLVSLGLLSPERTDDADEIGQALGKLVLRVVGTRANSGE